MEHKNEMNLTKTQPKKAGTREMLTLNRKGSRSIKVPLKHYRVARPIKFPVTMKTQQVKETLKFQLVRATYCFFKHVSGQKLFALSL